MDYHGAKLCDTCWMNFHSVSRSTFYRRKADVVAGKSTYLDGRSMSESSGPKLSMVTEWMKNHFDETACIMPDTGNSNSPHAHALH